MDNETLPAMREFAEMFGMNATKALMYGTYGAFYLSMFAIAIGVCFYTMWLGLPIVIYSAWCANRGYFFAQAIVNTIEKEIENA